MQVSWLAAMLIRHPAAILAAILGYFSPIFSQVCIVVFYVGIWVSQSVAVAVEQPFLSERKLWEECTELANLLPCEHKAYCPYAMFTIESDLNPVWAKQFDTVPTERKHLTLLVNIHPVLPMESRFLCFCIIDCTFGEIAWMGCQPVGILVPKNSVSGFRTDDLWARALDESTRFRLNGQKVYNAAPEGCDLGDLGLESR